MPSKYVKVADRPGYVAPPPKKGPKSVANEEPSITERLSALDIDILVGFKADPVHREMFQAYFDCRAKDNLARIKLGLLSEQWDMLVTDAMVKKGFTAIKNFIVEALELDYTLLAGVGDAKATRDILAIYSDDWQKESGEKDGIIVPKLDKVGNATWMTQAPKLKTP